MISNIAMRREIFSNELRARKREVNPDDGTPKSAAQIAREAKEFVEEMRKASEVDSNLRRGTNSSF